MFKTEAPSSNRVKAAFFASRADHASKSRYKSIHQCDRRATKKNKKQKKYLVHVEASDTSCFSKDECDGAMLFFDGGNEGNPPISPPETSSSKPIKVKSIVAGELTVPKNHTHDPAMGFINCCSKTQTINFLLVPRIHALAGSKKDAESNNNLCNGFDATTDRCRKTMTRGAARCVIRDDDQKYICVGSKVNRAGKGVIPIHHALQLLEEHHN